MAPSYLPPFSYLLVLPFRISHQGILPLTQMKPDMSIFLRHMGLTMLLSLTFGLFAQEGPITVSGQLTNCERDTIYFFVLDGVSLRPQGAIPLTEVEGSKAFSVQLPDLPKGFYLLGGGQQADTRMLLLGDESSVDIAGACPTLGRAAVYSEDNNLYQQTMQKAGQLGQEFQKALRQYQVAQRQGGKALEAATQVLATIDSQKLALLDEAYAGDSLVGKSIALQTYLSYPAHGDAYPNEGQYFANTYFQFVDWSDPVLDRVPAVHDAARTYGRTLASVGLTNEQQVAYGDNLVGQVPEGAPRRKALMLGLVAGFQQPNPDAFVHFARRYLKEFPQDNPQVAQQLQQQISAIESLLIGAEAPEISLPTPEGDTLSLSDLRGEVVLIDFWASWCGPCRRENPNVVRMYERLHERGFEILGVSLDRNRDAWVKAIAADGLEWHHVSDLQYWSSAAARAYDVHSIPHTVLLDREGHIVAKGLRGQALEKKVEALLEQ